MCGGAGVRLARGLGTDKHSDQPEQLPTPITFRGLNLNGWLILKVVLYSGVI